MIDNQSSTEVQACGLSNNASDGGEKHLDRQGWSGVAGSRQMKNFAKSKYGSGAQNIIILLVVVLMALYLFFTGGEETSLLSGYFKNLTNTTDTAITALIFLAIVISIYLKSRNRKNITGIEGKVSGKEVEISTTVSNSGLTRAKVNQTPVYIISMAADSGKKFSMKTENGDLSNYYIVGDAVRYHNIFKYMEKYDKTGDTISFCPYCKNNNQVERDVCLHCGCPLLK